MKRCILRITVRNVLIYCVKNAWLLLQVRIAGDIIRKNIVG